MNLREYAQQNQEAAADFKTVSAVDRTAADKPLNNKISEGCRLQILKDLQEKQNPYRILLTAAEAISRLDNEGDTFFLQVRDKLIEIYGRDISEDYTEIN